MRPSGSPMYTRSGQKGVITPGDVVHILDEREYRVLRINPIMALWFFEEWMLTQTNVAA